MKKFLLIPLFLFACLSGWDATAQCTAPSPTDIMISAPTSLSATPASSTSINLSWAAGTGTITGYDIYRNTPAAPTTFCLVGSTSAAVLNFANIGLTAATSYTYRVYSKSATGFSLPTADFTNATPVNITAPSNVTAVPVMGRTDQITVSWADNSTNESGFQVFLTNAAGSTETLVGTTSFPTFIVPNLTPNTTYYFRVKAYVLNTPPAAPTYSAAAMSGPVTTFVNPITPSGLQVFPIGYDRATVCFDDNSTNEIRFEIILNQQTIEIPAYAGTGRRCYELTNLFPKNNYAIYIRAIAPGNTRADLLPSIPFVTCPAPPNPPINLAIANSDMNSSVTVSWGVVGGFDDLKVMIIERSTDGVNWAQVGTQNRLLQTFTDNTASGGTRYLYRIIAVNTCDFRSNPSQSIVFQRTAPAAVYDLKASVISDKQVDLSWGLPVDGLTDKRNAIGVWRREGNGVPVQIATLEPFLFNYQDKTAKPKTQYTYYIQTANVIGQTKSAEVTVTTPGPPDAPFELKATPVANAIGNSTFFIDWKHVFEDEDYFTIEESIEGGAWVELQQINKTATSITRIPIEEGVKYSYRVRGWNKWGFSGFSNVVDATFAPTKAPNAPFNLKAKAISASEIQLTWLDDANSESGFEVESSSDGKAFKKVADAKRNELTFSNIGLAEKTKVFYRVRAINSRGNSDYTNIADATTLAKVSAVAFVENISGEIQVYPNPTTDYALIKMSNEVKGVKNVIVVDRNSRVVMKSTLSENQNELMLNMTTLMEGVYTVTITSENGKVTKRVAKN